VKPFTFVPVKLKFVIILLMIFTVNGLHAQVRVYGFDELKPLLNQQSDTTYVINFWATWCAPCVKELPDFEKINAQFSAQKFRMILVSLDFKRSLETRLIPFVREKNLKAEVIMLHEPDANSWIDKVDPKWTGAIPATLIYNKDFRDFLEGSYTYDELYNIIINNLKQ